MEDTAAIVAAGLVAVEVADERDTTMKKQIKNEDINICMIAAYASPGKNPDRASAFVSTTNNKMVDCKSWENIDFDNDKQVQAITDELNALIAKYDAYPVGINHFFDKKPCSKCKKTLNMMCRVEGENGYIHYACFPCKLVGEPVRG